MASATGTVMFRQAEVHWHCTPTVGIPYRRVGDGPPLVFQHGWPLWSFTFRKLLPSQVPQFSETGFAADRDLGG